MNYEKTVWKDSIIDIDGIIISKGTPVSAKNLNNLEEGIFDVNKQVDDHVERKDNPHLVTSSQVNITVAKLATDRPETFKEGITTFAANSASLGYPADLGTVITSNANSTRIFQSFYAKDGRVFTRSGNGEALPASGWTAWIQLESTSGAQSRVDAALKSIGAGTNDAVDFSSADINTTIKGTLFFKGNAMLNAPNTYYYYGLQIQYNSTSFYQMIWRNSPTAYNEIYVRSCTGGVWSPWIRMQTDATPDWKTPTFQNGWGAAFTDRPLRYAIDGNNLKIRGTAGAGTIGDNTPVFTLPAGFRPAETRVAVVATLNTAFASYPAARCVISTGGTVTISSNGSSGGPTQFSFDIVVPLI